MVSTHQFFTFLLYTLRYLELPGLYPWNPPGALPQRPCRVAQALEIGLLTFFLIPLKHYLPRFLGNTLKYQSKNCLLFAVPSGKIHCFNISLMDKPLLKPFNLATTCIYLECTKKSKDGRHIYIYTYIYIYIYIYVCSY